jgi:hypothetical protein
VLDFVNVEQFQYGNPDILCLPLVAAHTPGQDLVVLTISPHSCYFPFLSGFVSPVLNPLGVLKTGCVYTGYMTFCTNPQQVSK